MRRCLSLLVLLALSTCGAFAGSADLAFNDDMARLELGWRAFGDRARVSAAWLHHQDHGNVGSLGLHVFGEASSARRLEAGVGGSLFYVDADAADGYALGVGAYARYFLRSQERVSIGGNLHFAPAVLAGGDVDGYRDVAIDVGYDVLDRARVLLGYHYVKADFDDDSEVTFDSDLYVGFRIEF